MNAFVLDPNPRIAAQMHCDKHVVKMCTEAAQVLWTVVFLEEGKIGQFEPTHMNHPLVSWARSSVQNFEWLRELGTCICEEYEYRYGREHASKRALEEVHAPSSLKSGDLHFVSCMPQEFRSDDPIESYRRFYLNAKTRMLTYTRREPPSWIPAGIAKYKLDSKLRLRRLACQNLTIS